LLGQVVPLEKEQDLPKISLPGANTLTKAGGGAVTQGDGGAPRQVIVGVAGQADRAVLQQRGRPVEGVIAGRDVERGGFRPGGAGAVAGRVVLVGQGFAAGVGAGQAAFLITCVRIRYAIRTYAGCPLFTLRFGYSFGLTWITVSTRFWYKLIVYHHKLE
ncbi:hypothetical protein, partial [Methylicorpusculum sp.]|uniref:hypothetical protein n=1 Tax=Methylicorpusculum sp. TaxID=2713644 RepID=UPI003A103A9E